MAKNQKFHVKYTIEARGISTNEFVPKMIDSMLRAYCASVNKMYQQTDIKLTKEK